MGSTSNEITMLIDTSKCIGCKGCQIACKQWHSLPVEADEGTATAAGSNNTLIDSTKSWAVNEWAGRGVEILFGTGAGQKKTISSNTATTLTVSTDWAAIPDSTSGYALSTVFNGSYTNPPDMSGSTLTVVKFKESIGSQSPWHFLKDQCRHCYQPKCKRACPNGVYKTNEGFVVFNTNCKDANVRTRKKPNPAFNPALPEGPTNPKRINMTFADYCPYNIPRYSASAGQYVKCDFCYDRFSSPDTTLQRDKSSLGISNPHTTACELACPSNAIITGPYDELMGPSNSYAKNRYRAIVGAYPLARLYAGRFGRVSVIYLLTDTADKYAGLPFEGLP